MNHRRNHNILQSQQRLPQSIIQPKKSIIAPKLSQISLSSLKPVNSESNGLFSSIRNIVTEPCSGKTALSLYSKYLDPYDKHEIANYQAVYFIRSESKTNYISSGPSYRFEPGMHIAFRYEQIEILGSGTFGTAVKCLDHKTQRFVAVKVMQISSEKDLEQIALEVSYMQRLQQAKRVVKMIDTFRFKGCQCIVTELLYKDLYNVIKSQGYKGLGEQHARMVGLQVATALADIHEAGIVHSDLKPENILYTDRNQKNVKVIDFGCSCNDGPPLYKVVQSLYYRCPEVIFNFKYGKQIDVWSFACILFEIATGRPLFHLKTEDDLIKGIAYVLGLPPTEMVARSPKMQNYFLKNQPVNREQANQRKRQILEQKMEGFSKEFVDLIASCLEWLPNKRLTMKDILGHPFFSM